MEREERNKRKVAVHLLNKYGDAIDEREIWRYRVNNILLLSSATIFSIVISINTAMGTGLYPKTLFYAALLSNGLCILSFLVLLYGQLYLQYDHADRMRQELGRLDEYLDLLESGKFLPPISIPTAPFYKYVQKVSFVIYALMVIFYMWFVFSIRTNHI